MESDDWIRAFYIFQELLTYTPDDPDARNFYAASEANAKNTAFFIEWRYCEKDMFLYRT